MVSPIKIVRTEEKYKASIDLQHNRAFAPYYFLLYTFEYVKSRYKANRI